jgi:hypothetical protein
MQFWVRIGSAIMEKRSRLRVPLKVTGSVECTVRKRVKCRTRDISAVGAFFESNDPIPVGTSVEMEIQLPLEKVKENKRHEAKMKVSGTVVRVEEGGVAVLFKGLKVLLSKKEHE